MPKIIDNHWNGLSFNDLISLAQTHGTPLYLYDVTAVNKRITDIQEHLNNQVKVYYAVKANPNLELLRSIQGVADGFDISSGGELNQLSLLDVEPQSISFAGPAKTESELHAAIEHRVGFISVESLVELNRIIRICESNKLTANIGLRINPLLMNRKFGLKMGGKPIQFGVDEEELTAIYKLIIEKKDYLEFRGVHVYAGSQCFDSAGIVDGVKNTLRIVAQLELDSGLFCRKINLGGGFGVSHGKESEQLDLQELATTLNPVLEHFIADTEEKREIILELGRYLTADAGIYITQIVSNKNSRGKSFYIVDGGLNHHLSAAGTFGTPLRSNFPARNLTRPDAHRVKCSIAGPSCNPTDLLGIDIDLEAAEIDDFICVFKSGSYGFTASPLLFLGRDTPVELVRRDNEIVVGRKRYSMTDFN
jgi:diaminopimelate decarboxylase